MDKLRECPFACGGEPVNEKRMKITRTGTEDKFRIVCTDCTCATPYFETIEEAAAFWNHRASPWISVEERLPEVDENVFVLASWGCAYEGFFCFEEDYCEDGCCGKYWSFDDSLFFPEDRTVTHWMPRPPGPGEASA